MSVTQTIMKHNVFLTLVAVFACFHFISCSDEMGELGSSIQPPSDGITIKSTSLPITTSTGYRDSVYVRTGYPLLGNLADPVYGNISAGYLAQFYVNSNFSWDAYNSSDSIIFNLLRTSVPKSLGYDWEDYHYTPWDSLCDNHLDSITLRIYYNTTAYGDSLAPMIASAYELNKGIDFETLSSQEFYSNNDFSDYYSEEHFLGSKAYTSANRELSDSIRGSNDYMPYIEIKLTDDLKDRFFRAAVEASIARDKKNPHHGEFTDVFEDIDTFRRELFSGVCLKTTFGEGNLMKVYYTAIYFFYRSFHKYDVDGTLLRNEDDSADSTYITSHVKYIAVTPDVIQMSGYNFTDENKSERLDQPDTTYITSPQGYYTIVNLPVGKIINTMIDDPQRSADDNTYFLNGANFYLKGYKANGVLMSANPAPYVLMVEQSEMTEFFEKSILPDSKTSCYAAYVQDSVTNQLYYYSFGNINSVILGLAEKYGWSKDGDKRLEDDFTVPMAILPVELTTNAGTSSSTILSVSNYILPTAVRLRRGEGTQNLQMVYTFENSGILQNEE